MKMLATLTAFALSCVVWIGPSAGAQAVDLEQAGVFVDSLAADASNMLGDPALEPSERDVRFRALLQHNFDVERIGYFVLGQYRRQASDQELAEFLEVFEDVLARTYSGRISKYGADDITVQRIVPDGDAGAIVTTTIITGNGEAARLDWRIRERGGALWVVDVLVEGVSIAQTLREEYGEVIRQRGGVSGLITALRQRLG